MPSSVRIMSAAVLLLLGLLSPSLASKLPADGHLLPIGNSGPNHKVEVVDGFVKPVVFVSEYLKHHRPVVMRGAVKDSPAFSKWNDAYLRSKAPAGKEGNVFVEYGKKENRSDPSGDMHFHKFLDTYNTTDMYMVHHVPAFLAPDIIMPYSIQCTAFNQNFADTVMWFSSGGTKSVFHNDGYENINCLYRGQKHLVLANVTKYSDLVPRILDVKSGSHSSVDVEKVDLVKYPFFVGMEFHIADMQAGDCLYIPFGWLHHVASTGSNLAVNVWMQHVDVDVKTCKHKPDTSLSLDKFTFNSKEEGEEAPPPPPPSKKKKPAPKGKKGKPFSIDPNLLIDNLAAQVMGENPSASKETFLERLMEGQTPTEQHTRLLTAIFNAVDVNKNGEWDEEDLGAVFPKKKETLLTAAILKWQKKATALGLSYDLFRDAGKSGSSEEPREGDSAEESSSSYEDRMTAPVSDPNIYNTVGEKEEL